MAESINSVYLFTPMGIGDYILMYGAVKEIAKQYDKIYYYAPAWYLDNVVRLYKTIPNVEIILCPFINSIFYHDENALVIGWENYEKALKENPDYHTDQYLYNTAKVPFHLKWDNFYLERDLNKEKEVYYDRLGLKDDEEYNIICDDISRSIFIPRDKINPNIKVVNPLDYQQISIFDFLYTAERAKEIHVFNTGFLTFLDIVNIKHDNLYYHKDIIGDPNRQLEHSQVSLRLDWKICTKEYEPITSADVINTICSKFKIISYLEIGVGSKTTFNRIACMKKHAIDPYIEDNNTYKITSDQFFEKNKNLQKYDIIFVDGIHTEKQVYQDVINSIPCLNEDGFIVVHDCNPSLPQYATPMYIGGLWNGTVYKAFIRLKKELSDWSCFVVDEAYGCGIITKRKILKNEIIDNIDVTNISWEQFDKNRKQLLQLITYKEFKTLLHE